MLMAVQRATPKRLPDAKAIDVAERLKQSGEMPALIISADTVAFLSQATLS